MSRCCTCWGYDNCPKSDIQTRKWKRQRETNKVIANFTMFSYCIDDRTLTIALRLWTWHSVLNEDIEERTVPVNHYLFITGNCLVHGPLHNPGIRTSCYFPTLRLSFIFIHCEGIITFQICDRIFFHLESTNLAMWFRTITMNRDVNIFSSKSISYHFHDYKRTEHKKESRFLWILLSWWKLFNDCLFRVFIVRGQRQVLRCMRC